MTEFYCKGEHKQLKLNKGNLTVFFLISKIVNYLNGF